MAAETLDVEVPFTYRPVLAQAVSITVKCKMFVLSRDSQVDGELVRPPLHDMLKNVKVDKPKKGGGDKKRKLDAEWRACSHLLA